MYACQTRVRPHVFADWMKGLLLSLALAATSAPTAVRAEPNGPARVDAICRSELGATPGEAHYAACVASLSQSLNDLERARSLAEARTGDRTDADARPVRSYMSVSPTEAHRREERACAMIGYDPAANGFGRCVAGLQTSLFMADNPLN
jgi:hypothetical protein